MAQRDDTRSEAYSPKEDFRAMLLGNIKKIECGSTISVSSACCHAWNDFVEAYLDYIFGAGTCENVNEQKKKVDIICLAIPQGVSEGPYLDCGADPQKAPPGSLKQLAELHSQVVRMHPGLVEEQPDPGPIN